MTRAIVERSTLEAVYTLLSPALLSDLHSGHEQRPQLLIFEAIGAGPDQRPVLRQAISSDVVNMLQATPGTRDVLGHLIRRLTDDPPGPCVVVHITEMWSIRTAPGEAEPRDLSEPLPGRGEVLMVSMHTSDGYTVQAPTTIVDRKTEQLGPIAWDARISGRLVLQPPSEDLHS